MRVKLSYVILLLILGAIFLLGFSGPTRVADQATGSLALPDSGQPRTFVGASVCRSCHKDIYDSQIHTAHFESSAPASLEAIKGSFQVAQNVFSYNQWMSVLMTADNGMFAQTSVINGVAFQTRPFNVVVGSGRKGQTYLYWDHGKLFQLPISFLTAVHAWCNSPGYPENHIWFNRRIPGRCLECHGTYAEVSDQGDGPVFDTSQVIYGITCERCHGPGSEHVAWHQVHPADTIARFIVSAGRLPRQLRLDACALCHSGGPPATQPPFTFQVGDRLTDYFAPKPLDPDTVASLDPHGNQYGLLIGSKCFRRSTELDCTTCHNPHADESGNLALFSSKCMGCHNAADHDTCTLPTRERKGLVLSNNCIDCHMPKLPSKKIVLELSDSAVDRPDYVRTHLVAIYRKGSLKPIR